MIYTIKKEVKQTLLVCFLMFFSIVSYGQKKSEKAVPQNRIVGELAIVNNQVIVDKNVLDLYSVLVENEFLTFEKLAVISVVDDKTVIDTTQLSKGLYYVKGIKDNEKVLYTIHK